jgi:DNA-binding CsgD family transcriptional regulator
MAIAPFNGFDHHHARSLGLGVVLVVVALAALRRRRSLFGLLRRQPRWLLVALALAIGVLWADGGWRSSYYLASYAPIALAAVAVGLRWSGLCGVVLAVGYVAGLAINGYSWHELKVLNDADSVVANTGGYLIAAYFFAAPVAWLGGYVARINQVAGGTHDGRDHLTHQPSDPAPDRLTDVLSVREIEVVQLVAGGATNEGIAEHLVLSPRTIQSHVENAMRKTETRNRTELAVLAVREGLVPAKEALDTAPAPATDPTADASSA